MKNVEISEDSAEIRALLEQARDEDIIVQLTDGSKFILSAVDDFEVEVVKTRQNKKLMALLDERGQQTQTISLAEVKRKLHLSD
ncbi:hypothetical protein IQ264_19040 [Phormidium sp. LEGE 05292]|uniref:hypothetical protein n=1 Tax=[Phormidium] sp. LEGE 05292 TaxID=767427 RepID=UPI00187E1B3A|nr:hypothetical protein [Phormidium sp. LEGE 05292]MBE9227528.1 hypothetical protein [Phormidium sp. LEGE 05292]